MKRIVLFRFHKNADVCASRINELKKHNPDVEIYGVGEQIEDIEKLYDAGIEHIHFITTKSTRWKWLHGDLVMQDWYLKHGHNIDFDYLHLIEWDLHLNDSLKNIYPDASSNTVYLTGTIPISEARKHGWGFVTGSRMSLVNMTKRFAEMQWGSIDEPRGCLFPGTSLPRAYFEKLNECVKIPEFCNDEIRTALFADAMGFEIKDTGFYTGWETEEVNKKFNCKNVAVENETIKSTNSSTAFHPVRYSID